MNAALTECTFFVIRCSHKESGAVGYHDGTWATGANLICLAKPYLKLSGVKRALAYHARQFARHDVTVVRCTASEINQVETPQ